MKLDPSLRLTAHDMVSIEVFDGCVASSGSETLHGFTGRGAFLDVDMKMFKK